MLNLDSHNVFISLVNFSHSIGDVYTHVSVAITESKLSRGGKWSRSVFSRWSYARAVRHSRSRWMVYASQGRVNLDGEGAGVYTVRRTHVYTTARSRINKEVGIYGRARAHASPLAFLSIYLCHEYSRASRIGFSIFDVSLARTLERSNVKVDTGGNYPVRCW